MTPAKYIAKAAHAAKSARILLLAGEHEGACNRAYYAMFNAAHAALLWSGAHINPGETKKHNSLIPAFGKHLVLTGLLPSDLGKALNKAENVRILADYTGEDSMANVAHHDWSTSHPRLSIGRRYATISP